MGSRRPTHSSRSREVLVEKSDPDVIQMNNLKVHTFNRLGFGPRPEDLEHSLFNLEEYLEEQLYPMKIVSDGKDQRLMGLDTLDMSPLEFLQKYPDRRQQRIGREQLTAAKLLRAVYSERQLQEVMVDFQTLTSQNRWDSFKVRATFLYGFQVLRQRARLRLKLNEVCGRFVQLVSQVSSPVFPVPDSFSMGSEFLV